MNNPLDDLARFDSSQLPAPTGQPAPPAPSPSHSSGRRELREERLARGITLRVRPATLDDRVKMMKGERVDSLPIRRADPKYGGLGKKAWKKARREARAGQVAHAEQAAKSDLQLSP